MKKIKIKETKNKGRGLFANKDFKKDEIIEKSPVIIISSDKNTPKEINDILFQTDDDNKFLLCLGLGSLFNHSDNENVYYLFEDNFLYFYAKDNIKKGNELSINYGETWFSDRGLIKY